MGGLDGVVCFGLFSFSYDGLEANRPSLLAGVDSGFFTVDSAGKDPKELAPAAF